MNSKLLLLFVAKDNCRNALQDALITQATSSYELLPSDGRSATVLMALEQDGFASPEPAHPLFTATLDLRISGSDFGPLMDASKAIGQQLSQWIIPEQAIALLGHDKVFIDCAPTPIRYQLVMRRRADFSNQAYIDYYIKHHSRFGFQTPAIDGYVQFHNDEAAASKASANAGLGSWAADSVSELHMASAEDFVTAISKDPDIGERAAADEALFVDRDSNLSFTSEVVLRLGDEITGEIMPAPLS